jgi:hypothetical protein
MFDCPAQNTTSPKVKSFMVLLVRPLQEGQLAVALKLPPVLIGARTTFQVRSPARVELKTWE